MGDDYKLPIGDENLGRSADPAKVKAQGKLSRALEAREDHDIAVVLSTREGRRLVWGILEYCQIERLSYVERNHDATVFNEGQRNIGLMLRSRVLRSTPDAYLLMIDEDKKEMEANNG